MFVPGAKHRLRMVPLTLTTLTDAILQLFVSTNILCFGRSINTMGGTAINVTLYVDFAR